MEALGFLVVYRRRTCCRSHKFLNRLRTAGHLWGRVWHSDPLWSAPHWKRKESVGEVAVNDGNMHHAMELTLVDKETQQAVRRRTTLDRSRSVGLRLPLYVAPLPLDPLSVFAMAFLPWLCPSHEA